MLERRSTAIEGVQYLRGMAAILVVMEHTATMMAKQTTQGTLPLTVYGYGHIGVHIFFVISGLIIMYTAVDRQLTMKMSRLEFAVRRALRILPFLWTLVFIYAVVRYAGIRRLEPWPYLRAIVLWPWGELRPNVVWTLRYEMMFYVVFGLIALRHRPRWLLLGAWALAGYPLQWLEIQWQWPVIETLVQLIFGPINLLFGVGMVFGVSLLRGQRWLSPTFRGGFGTAVLVSMIAMVAVWKLTPTENGKQFLFICLLSGVVVWVGVRLRPSSGRLSQLGALLGGASYSIYLTHTLALLVMLEMVKRFPVPLSPVVLHAALATAAAGSGVAAHIFVERPLLRRASQMTRSWTSSIITGSENKSSTRK